MLSIRQAICAGCLSQDRKMTAIKDLKKYAFFCYALAFDEKDWVCWECRRMVIKLAVFRNRVAKAQSSLADLISGRPCQIKSISKLTTVTITDQRQDEDTFVEVETLDPLYYQLVKETVQSDDDAASDDDSVDNDEATGDDETVGDEANHDDVATGDEEAMSEERICDDVMGDEIRDDVAMGDEEVVGDVATGHDEVVGDVAACDDIATSEGVTVEELVYEDADNNKAAVQITYIDETIKAADGNTGNSIIENIFSNVSTVGNSSSSNIVTLSTVHLSLDEADIPLPQPKPKIQKNARSIVKIVPSNAGEKGTRTEDTFVVIENPFTVEMMSQDEMIFWRLRKRNMEYFASCSPLLRCEECIEPFDTQRMYTAHMKGHSKDFGEKQCEICELNFHDEEEMKIHKERHYKLLKCKHCEFQWDSSNGMRSHAHKFHGIAIEAWVCDHCTREFAELFKLQRHRVCHQGRRCPECGVMLRSHVKKHMLRVHKNLPMLSCRHCGLECKGHSGLQAHEKSCRSVADETFCVECNVQYRNKYSYRAHFKNTLKHASDKPLRYQCTQCGKGFLDPAKLAHHVDSIHEKQKKYLCEVCGKGFFTMVSRRKHERRAHSDRPKRKNHVCAYCGKTFERQRELDQHTNKHTGNRPYKCKCGASFGFECGLRNHVRLKHSLPHSTAEDSA